jgi:hypothetical protein
MCECFFCAGGLEHPHSHNSGYELSLFMDGVRRWACALCGHTFFVEPEIVIDE